MLYLLVAVAAVERSGTGCNAHEVAKNLGVYGFGLAGGLRVCCLGLGEPCVALRV